MFSLTNRGKLDQPVQEEFERLFAKLRGFLSQTFDEDGELIVADPNFAIFGIGDIKATAAHTPQSGFLMCDGSQVSRVTYKSLYDAIGTDWGIGDGSTTFNLPDFRQKFLIGCAVSGVAATIGASGGAFDHTHSGGSHTHSTPDHTHTFSDTTAANGAHSHTVNSHTHAIGSGGSHAHNYAGTTGAENEGNVDVNSGGSIPVPISPNTHNYSGTTDSDGSHDHGGNTGAESPGTTTDGNHAHNFSGTTASGGASTTGSASGTTGTANPPYAVVNYMIFAGV